MSGVWVFKNGVAKPMSEAGKEESHKRKVLVYVPTNDIMCSYAELERRLSGLGWQRYRNNENQDLLQFHKGSSLQHLISLPRDFSKFKSPHMYDIVVKNRSYFEVRDFYD